MKQDEWMKAMREGWEHLKPYIEEVIEREVAARVHAAKMDILRDVSGETVRDTIRKEVQRWVSVEVKVGK